MLLVLFSVLCSVTLSFLFKLFPRFGVDNFQAILFNYPTCLACGWIYLGEMPLGPSTAPWWWYALGLGGVFISGFVAAALTVSNFGVTVSQIMQKMTILVTVPFAILVFSESAGWAKILGCLLAVAAIVFTNLPHQDSQSTNQQSTISNQRSSALWLPIATWVLACVIDTAFVWVQGKQLIVPGDVRFICTIFATAGTIGLAFAVYGWSTGRLQFSWRNVLAGVVLGVPNFGSLVFLLKALGSGLEGSVVFPLTNVGIILVSTFGAVLLFHERLSRLNWIGIGLAVLAIVLMI